MLRQDRHLAASYNECSSCNMRLYYVGCKGVRRGMHGVLTTAIVVLLMPTFANGLALRC